MAEGVLAIIWLMITSIAAIVMVIIIRKYISEERHAMIEKGVSPADFKLPKGKSGRSFITLKFALLLVGLGLGLIVGSFLDMAFHIEEVAYFSMIFIFGGIGLGIAYVVESRHLDKESTQE